VGSYAVGKTSLVERYVRSIYSDKYHTTIGVKIDKKVVDVDGRQADCIIWDIAGEDEFYTVKSSYLRGMRGYLLVLDGTRSSTIEVAEAIYHRVESDFNDVPYVLLINKSDLVDEWEVRDPDIERLSAGAVATFRTSAKTGDQVEAAFTQLARAMLNE
jgi:small GTP-binding protein